MSMNSARDCSILMKTQVVLRAAAVSEKKPRLLSFSPILHCLDAGDEIVLSAARGNKELFRDGIQ